MNVNFNIHQDIFDTFLLAQNESSTLRYFKVIIDNETLILSSSVEKDKTADVDFDTILLPNLKEDEAALYIYSLKDHFLSSEGWLLIVLIPDDVKVRDKMLYASSKEYLKKQLGTMFFKHEISFNDIKDVSWSYFYKNNILNRSNLKILSEKEILIKEEKILATQESSITSNSKKASIELQFDIDSQVITAIKELNNNMIIELTITSEKIVLKSSNNFTNNEALKSYINDDDACYYLFKIKDSISLILNCPDTISARKKMTIASARSSLISLCTEHGVKLFKTIELSGSNDFDPSMLDATIFDAASQAAIVKSAKPSAPGKSSTKTRTKFVMEE